MSEMKMEAQGCRRVGVNVDDMAISTCLITLGVKCVYYEGILYIFVMLFFFSYLFFPFFFSIVAPLFELSDGERGLVIV